MFLSGRAGVTVKPLPYQQHRGQSHKTNTTHKKHKLVTGGFSLSEKHPALLEPYDPRKYQQFGIKGPPPIQCSRLHNQFLITSRLVLKTSLQKKDESDLMIASP